MRGAFVIYRRELAVLFFSPLAWILLFVSLLLNGYLFSAMFSNAFNPGDVNASFEFVFGGNLLFWGLMWMLPPLLTMRLLAEEAASGTLEFLRTAPVSDAAVVGGKFLAGTTFMALLWSSAFLYAAAIQVLAIPPDWGRVTAIWVGAVLVSGLLVAIGLVTSSLTNTPLLAAFLSMMACLFWLTLPILGGWLLDQMGVLLADLFGSVEAVETWIVGGLDRMAVVKHFGNSYYHGVLDSSEVVFFLTWTAFFLFLTTRTLEARRWRG